MDEKYLFNEILREITKAKGISQLELSKRLGYSSPVSVNRLFQRKTLINLDTVLEYLEASGTPLKTFTSILDDVASVLPYTDDDLRIVVKEQVGYMYN
jgi:transcriptional regulator with XRE-family HTH domain